MHLPSLRSSASLMIEQLVSGVKEPETELVVISTLGPDMTLQPDRSKAQLTSA